MSTHRLAPIVVAVAIAVLVGAIAPSAGAKDGDVRVRGACTAASTVELTLSDEDGRLEIELEVDQNRNGVRWKVVLRRNGKVVRRAAPVTRAPSGSFTLRRVIANAPGVDRVVAVATSPARERCVARASF
jgi:hypothetical protein